MPGTEESLFSLELVVDKVYIPHTTCRFPAIAFRLLDFPTILISHVEPDLSQTIKAKLSRDPYYQLPKQFSELKDKHGNFMVKKGKSCLFKIPVDNLKMHLTNTPLYVMIIDTFPDIPKLLGNSTVPLNSLMEYICTDISKLGSTVPSVHGDKGLFKLYNLMGKEIGYFVLGFRLLCLGPGLIPHLPAEAITRRLTRSQKEINIVQETLSQSKFENVADHMSRRNDIPHLNNTHEVGSMTETEKHDAVLQTLEFQDKAVHVEISAPDYGKVSVTASTQTERHRRMNQALNENQKFTFEEQDEDSFIINDLVCPPPMFYNNKCDPKIKMQKVLCYEATSSENDLSVENLDTENEKNDIFPEKTTEKHETRINQSMRQNHHSRPQDEMFRKEKMQHVWSEEKGKEAFPVLTALLNELTGIQNANFSRAIATINEGKSLQQQRQVVQLKSSVAGAASKRLQELSQPRQVNNNLQSKANGEIIRSSGIKNFRHCAKVSPVIPKNKGWLRQAPEQSVKRSQLAFGLTHTQRLRLAKKNPGWLKAVEKEADLKKKKEEAMTASIDSDAELNVTNLSDTITEVRMLAQKELEKAGQTMDTTGGIPTIQSEQSLKSDSAKANRHASPSKGKNWLSRYGKRSPSPKQRRKLTKYQERQKKQDFINEKQRTIVNKRLSHAAPVDADESSQRSEQSQKSIEVHVPSAQIDEEEDLSDMTLDDRDTLPDDNREIGGKFQGFGKAEDSFPDSIDGKPDDSLSETRNSDQPLESTRISTNERLTKLRESSDCDTRQFMSTDEPELQGLMSDEENIHSDSHHSGRHGHLSGAVVSTSITSSVYKFPVVNPVASEQSPVPATRRSTVKIDLGPSRELTQQQENTCSQDSSKRPTPRPRGRPVKFGRESINTDSVSSYQPSDPDNVLVSLSSDANYSDDFHPAGSEFDDSLTDISSPDIIPRYIPSTKLGYTIT